MRDVLIYIGIALAILIASILVFKPEFSMITGTTNPNSRIMSITPSGDLVLSDNTVKNINDYIDKMKSDLLSEITKQVGAEKTARERAVNSTNSSLSGLANNVKDNYVRYEDEMQIAGTYGCGQYKNISTYLPGVANGVANHAPLGANDPNPRFVIRKRCGGCDTNSGGRNKTLDVHRGNKQAHGCKGF